MFFDGLTLREKVAQTAVILNSNGKFVNDPVGGVFIGAQVITEVEDGVSVMRDTVTKYRNNMSTRPLIMSDFENGCGSMIKGLTVMPFLMSLGAANDEQLAYDYGKATALEALSAGANTTFSPVCDINYNFRNPLVNIRAVLDNADRAIPLLKAIIKGMQDNGLAACAKHFPGDGVDWRDQHIVTTENSLSMDKWWDTYGRVFGEMIKAGVSMIMAGHITLPAYQKERKNGFPLPATLSKELICDLLKGEMGFKGVVVSDASMMGGFNGYYKSKTETQIECFKAGCDLVLWPTDDYIDGVTKAIESGYIPMERLEDALYRIGTIKEKFVPSSDEFPELNIEQKQFVKNVQQKVSENSITLVKNIVNLFPLKNGIKKVLLISLCNHNAGMPAAMRLEDCLKARGIEVFHYFTRPSDEEFDEKANEADIILYAMYTRSFRPVGPVDFWDNKCWDIAKSYYHSGEKSAYVSFGSPYFANQYFERANTYVNAYSMLEPTVDAFVKAMFGEIPFGTDSPVKLELPKPELF